MTDFEERFAEGLARTINRRRFLRKTSQVAFVGLSGAVASGMFARGAGGHTKNGQAHCANLSHLTYCNFPNSGTSCGPGCNGHACPAGYYWTSAWEWNSACWCSNVHGTSYSICCDCSLHQNATQTYPTDCGCSSEVRIL